MNRFAILITRLLNTLLRLIHRGGSLPGQIGLKISPNILSALKINVPVILVTGTNGKTSTSNMIAAMFEAAGLYVVSNRKGDNLKEGITTSLICNTSIVTKRVFADMIVLEVDELNIPYIVSKLPVDSLVVTNFFRDQLDRAKEMEQLILKIEQVMPTFTGTLILNANDPNVVRLKDKAEHADVLYYGMQRCVSSVEKSREASEGKFCPRCGARLTYAFYQYSHIGQYHCTNCSFQTPDLQIKGMVKDIPKRLFSFDDKLFHAPQDGLYTMYNCLAVLAAAKKYHIKYEYVDKAFNSIKVPEGRNEVFTYNNYKLVLNLIKNPTGANEVMKVIEEDDSDKTVFVVLNDNIQDGTDISWIYDTLFEKLMNEHTKQIIISGTRCYDMALRLKYGGHTGSIVVRELLKDGVSELLQAHMTMYVIATYTALQPVRSLLIAGMKTKRG